MYGPTETDAIDHFHRMGAAHVVRRKIHAARIAITSNDLAYLSALPDLEELVLTQCGITDDCLSVISTLTKLRLLDLSDNWITDEGGKNIVTLKKLTCLGIYGTPRDRSPPHEHHVDWYSRIPRKLADRVSGDRRWSYPRKPGLTVAG